MSKVVNFNTYRVLGQWDQLSDRLLSMAIQRNDETLMSVVIRMRELHADMFEALQDERKSQLEFQLEASIASLKSVERKS